MFLVFIIREIILAEAHNNQISADLHITPGSLINNSNFELPSVPSLSDNSTQQLLWSLSSLLTYFTLLASTYTAVVCSLNVTINLSTFQTTPLLFTAHRFPRPTMIRDSGYMIQQHYNYENYKGLNDSNDKVSTVYT